MQPHRVRRRHDLDDVLQDEEPEERREVELAEERRQDAAVDLEVGLGDLAEGWGVEGVGSVTRKYMLGKSSSRPAKPQSNG